MEKAKICPHNPEPKIRVTISSPDTLRADLAEEVLVAKYLGELKSLGACIPSAPPTWGVLLILLLAHGTLHIPDRTNRLLDRTQRLLDRAQRLHDRTQRLFDRTQKLLART